MDPANDNVGPKNKGHWPGITRTLCLFTLLACQEAFPFSNNYIFDEHSFLRSGYNASDDVDILLSMKVALVFDEQTLCGFARSLSACIKMNFATYKFAHPFKTVRVRIQGDRGLVLFTLASRCETNPNGLKKHGSGSSHISVYFYRARYLTDLNISVRHSRGGFSLW